MTTAINQHGAIETENQADVILYGMARAIDQMPSDSHFQFRGKLLRDLFDGVPGATDRVKLACFRSVERRGDAYTHTLDFGYMVESDLRALGTKSDQQVDKLWESIVE